jgi:hypothetical protein
MQGSADSESVAPSWQVAAAGRAPTALQALRWLYGLPESLGVAITVVALFSLAVIAIAAAFGAPLLFPSERVSHALGYNAVLPVLCAIVFYAALRLFKAVAPIGGIDEAPLARMIATDLVLMGLFLVATYFHFSLKTWVQVINPVFHDDIYMAVDRRLQPVLDVFYWIRTHVLGAVPNTDAWYQAAFLLMFVCGFCSLAVTRNAVYPRFCVGVLLTMCLGALSYLIAPALGPFIYESGLNAHATEAQAGMLWAHEQVARDGMAWITKVGSDYFTGGLAAMPSLHMAHAVVMTWFICKARSPLIPIFLLICFWVLIESVASRWHYLIDLPAGALLAVFIIWLTSRLCPLPPPAAEVERAQESSI